MGGAPAGARRVGNGKGCRRHRSGLVLRCRLLRGPGRADPFHAQECRFDARLSQCRRAPSRPVSPRPVAGLPVDAGSRLDRPRASARTAVERTGRCLAVAGAAGACLFRLAGFAGRGVAGVRRPDRAVHAGALALPARRGAAGALVDVAGGADADRRRAGGMDRTRPRLSGGGGAGFSVAVARGGGGGLAAGRADRCGAAALFGAGRRRPSGLQSARRLAAAVLDHGGAGLAARVGVPGLRFLRRLRLGRGAAAGGRKPPTPSCRPPNCC